MCIQTLRGSISGSKYRFNRNRSVNFKLQEYCTFILDRKYIVSLTKLLTSCHLLYKYSITKSWDRGGHSNVPFNQQNKYVNTVN